MRAVAFPEAIWLDPRDCGKLVQPPMLTNRQRLLLLNMASGVGPTRLRRLLEAFGTLERVCSAAAEQLQCVAGIGPLVAARIAETCRNERLMEQELTRAAAHKAAILTLEDAAYPTLLRAIYDPPLALYVRGTLEPSDEIAVGIVGARRASSYGLQAAERLGYDLALRGVTVVSGLAVGIDGAAHRGALKAGGRTVAVLGSGLARLYPPEHRALADQVAEHGALLSEYPMETAPLPAHFPQRNRLISGLSLGVVVVEAGPRSGALITADCALEQGREVFAVPGPITSVTSQGTHELLRHGAALVGSVDDILEALRLIPQPAARHAAQAEETGASEAPAALPDVERRVFVCVEDREPSYVDAIAQRSGLALPQVSSALLQLELKRLVRQLPGKQFIKTR